jgi:hypothetical protein
MEIKQRLALLQQQRGELLHVEPAAGAATRATMGERLQRLGRRPARARMSDEQVARALGGQCLAQGLIRIDTDVPLAQRHGKQPLARLLRAQLHVFCNGPAPAIGALRFIDTETTGLGGGTGTLPFLVGIARVKSANFCVRQYFLTGFQGESALLTELAGELGEGAHLATFNGKSFDAPLLSARYRLARLPDPLNVCPHLDLLHPLRSAYASVWPDCRLQTAERQLLGFQRSDDLPGEMVPQAWFDFMRQGEFARVPDILLHNRLDLLSLAALTAALGQVYDDPEANGVDRLAIARVYLRQGNQAAALRHLHQRRDQLDASGLLQLARIHRTRGEWDSAVDIWQRLAHRGVLEALEALAKYYEHVTRNFALAFALTERIVAQRLSEDEPLKRRQRLVRKMDVARDRAT